MKTTTPSVIQWHGEADAEYLRQIRAGGKYIFYTLLQDLYAFSESVCGGRVNHAIGAQLAKELLRKHMPDLLYAVTVRSGSLPEQILWLLEQFLEGKAVLIDPLKVAAQAEGNRMQLRVAYADTGAMVEALKRSGHNPEVAFTNRFQVMEGSLQALFILALHAFSPEQIQSRLNEIEGHFDIRLTDENRFDYERLIEILLEYVGQLRGMREAPEEPEAAESAICRSEAMLGVWERIRKASGTHEMILLSGESGTGKSYYARVIHQLSPRLDGPFIEVGLTSDVGSDNLVQSNLFGHVRGAFTGAEEEKRGLFALADGGTIFLDEIGDASPELQGKLLRVLESKCFKMLGGVEDIRTDIRILAATNKDLPRCVREGSFREDLFYRLNVIRVDLPPLRERRADLPSLVDRLFHKVRMGAQKPNLHLSEEARDRLCGFDWPGNIRQLENALRHAAAFAEGDWVRAEDLPPPIGGPPAATGTGDRATGAGKIVNGEALLRSLPVLPAPEDAPAFVWPCHIDYARREYLKALIQHHRGNLGKIAKHWDRSSENTLLKLIREFDLEDELKAARKSPKEGTE
ncbi:MAG: sigma 54-interacting transcriptional regulator [Planctomycetota bacterium]